MNFTSNITDSSALYYHRAKSLAKKIDIQHIHRLLRLYGLYVPTKVEVVDEEKGARFPEEQPSIESVVAILQGACAPAVSPFLVRDVAHNHRDKISYVISFIHTMYGGGHCSLFSTTRLTSFPEKSLGASVGGVDKKPKGDAFHPMIAFSADANGEELDGKQQQVVPAEEEEEDPMPTEELGSRMMADVSEGLDSLQETCALNDTLSHSIRRCITNTEVDEVRNYLEGLFEYLSLLGKPLNREKIEKVTRHMVDKADYRVLEALYPANGIDSFTSLVNYMTGVAEFSSWPIMTVAEMLESHYTFDWRDEMRLALADPELAHFFALNSKDMDTLQLFFMDPNDKSRLSLEQVRKVFLARLQLTSLELDTAWENAGENPGVVMAAEFEQLLYLCASWVDPSPFTSPMRKIASLLDRIIPYVKEIWRRA